MKHLFLFLALLLLGSATRAQIVYIPDTNFKAKLLTNWSVIDTNGDGEIQISEAEAYTDVLSIEFSGIYDLTGIEAFTNLIYFLCFGNHLTTIDLSANTALSALQCENNNLTTLDLNTNINLNLLICNGNELVNLDLTSNTALDFLHCQDNELTSLDLSNNTALGYLECGFNELTSLDLSNNMALSQLECRHNQLTTLNLSSNVALTRLWCEENPLTSLNVKNGNNINISSDNFMAANNPNLYCIQVDDPIWSETNWINYDAEVIFSEHCDVGIADEYSTVGLAITPNPFNNRIELSFEKEAAYEIRIYDLSGKKALSTTIIGTRKSIPTSELPNGAYILKAKSKEGIVIKKIIKYTW